MEFQTPAGRVILDFRGGKGAGSGLLWLWLSGKTSWERWCNRTPKGGEMCLDEEGPKVPRTSGN